MPYQTLDADELIATIRVLGDRIHERFPGASLGSVCDELEPLAVKARDSADWIARPNVGLRLAIAALVLLVVIGAGTIWAAIWTTARRCCR